MAEIVEGDLVSITPSDTVDVAKLLVRLYVGGTGAIKVDTEFGTTVTIAAVAVGLLDLGVKIKRIYSTGTTATNIIGVTGNR